jgi:hypothetical protein
VEEQVLRPPRLSAGCSSLEAAAEALASFLQLPLLLREMGLHLSAGLHMRGRPWPVDFDCIVATMGQLPAGLAELALGLIRCLGERSAAAVHSVGRNGLVSKGALALSYSCCCHQYQSQVLTHQPVQVG